MKKEKKVKNKKKKVKRLIGRKEFIFNIVSIGLVILLGIYFGGRSLYYYSKQNMTIKKEEETLKSAVLKNNKITTDVNGLHQEKDGYLFKGMVDNNYVLFANRLYRIMHIQEDNSVQIVSNTNEGILNWGEEEAYLSSNLYHWLNKGDNEHSGVYQKTIPGDTKFLKKTEWCEGVLKDKTVKCGKTEKSYFSILTLKDYVDIGGKNSYLYNKQNSWLLGKNESNENLYVAEDGTVGSATTTYEGYGVRVVMTLKKNIKITGGTGTLGDPYVINQEKVTNSVGQYVKLGNDVYKVYEENGNQLRLSLNDYLKVGETYLERIFSNKEALYSPLNRYSIAYYLNRDFYNSLPYKTLLSECSFPVGEISTTAGIGYFNQYNETISNKVGLLSLYDWNNNELTDYYLMNTTGSSMAFVYNKTGILEEEKVREKKKVVPTICLDKTLIKAGDGRIENPYVVE